MNKGKTKKFLIAKIERRMTPRSSDPFSFLVTNPTGETMWLNKGFILSIFTGMGLSTKTPFIKLAGTTVEYEEIAITEEMLAEGNGEVVVTDRNGREITFTKANNNRQYSQSVLNLSAALQAQIDSVAVTFEDDWANVNAAQQPRTVAVQTPAPEVQTGAQTENNVETAEHQPPVEANLDEETGL